MSFNCAIRAATASERSATDGQTVVPGEVWRVAGGVLSVRKVGRVASGVFGVREIRREASGVLGTREVDAGCCKEVDGV